MALGVGAFAMAVLPTGLLWIAFILVGAGNGLIDVFMNVEAQRVEVATGRPVLQWLHASYAAGGVTGAVVAGAIVAAGMTTRSVSCSPASSCSSRLRGTGGVVRTSERRAVTHRRSRSRRSGAIRGSGCRHS
jgi:hypothetical protein